MSSFRQLSGLDEALIGLLQTMQSSTYRRRLLAASPPEAKMGTMRVLRAVERAGPDPSVGQVADALVLSHSATSRLIEETVRQGYLERARGEADRRQITVLLTTTGQQYLDAADAARRQLLSTAVADWSDADVHRVATLLLRLLGDLREQ